MRVSPLCCDATPCKDNILTMNSYRLGIAGIEGFRYHERRGVTFGNPLHSARTVVHRFSSDGAQARYIKITCAIQRPDVSASSECERERSLLEQCTDLKKQVASFALSALLILSQGVIISQLVIPPVPAHAVTNEQLLYLEAWRAVDRAYVDKTFNGQSWFRVRENTLKNRKLITREDTHEEIKSMLKSLDDPFTRFLEPEQYQALKGATRGDVTGVGLEVSFPSSLARDKKGKVPLVVISPSPAGPAERAGIKAGDEILQIDGLDTESMSLYAAGNALQGASGSSVSLKIKNSSNMVKEITLTREKINIKGVEFGNCIAKKAPSTRVGYIRIASFSKKTAEKVREAIEDLKNKNVEYYVLDIRNNGGGVFAAGIEVGRMLINSGDLVLIADSDGVRDVYEAEGQALDTKTPMIVLVNKGTASASEVLAGALKDDKRATIVGENTFGKGLIQTLVELSDGSAVTVTVSKYQTPNGIDINKKGIEPDVRLTGDELEQIPLGPDKFCKFLSGDEPLVDKIFV